MKKLRLNLDDIKVESFATGPGYLTGRGTVFGQNKPPSTPDPNVSTCGTNCASGITYNEYCTCMANCTNVNTCGTTCITNCAGGCGWSYTCG